MTAVKIGWTSIGDFLQRSPDIMERAVKSAVDKVMNSPTEGKADSILSEWDNHLADIYRRREENYREALEAASELIKRGERRAIRVARLRHVHLSNSKHNRNG